MGGMFDPIHNGHLRAAENARRDARLDAVMFVPAGVPPHREPPEPDHRLAALQIHDDPQLADHLRVARPDPRADPGGAGLGAGTGPERGASPRDG